MSQANQTEQFNFTQAQVTKLCQMQDELNSYIHPAWKDQDFDWYEAIIDECGEIKGHLGWKWWKKDYQVGMTDSNRKQIQLEVIDILHFLLSGLIETQPSPEEIATIFNGSIVPTNYTLANAVDRMRFMACDGYYSAVQWSWMAQLVGLTEQEILETYTQKYVLNKFRQDHGYKTGSYVKIWREIDPAPPEGSFGICYLDYEDNQVLANIVERLKLCNHDTTDETLLYNELSLAYNSRLNK